MADPGITLNIYNKPPQLNEDEENNDNNDNNNNNINQTTSDINQTTNLPTKSVVENGRIDATSALLLLLFLLLLQPQHQQLLELLY